MKRFIIISSLIFSILLTSCSSGKQMEKSFAQIHSLETEMRDIQEKVYRIDEEEAVIFEKIIAMGGSKEKDIEQLIKEAYVKLEKKSHYLKEEKDIFIEAREELTNVEKIYKEGSDEVVKEMISLLKERYTYYEAMHEEQIQSIELNEELYQLLIKKANRKQIEGVLQEINEQAVAIQANHKQFNILTEKYNELVLEE